MQLLKRVDSAMLWPKLLRIDIQKRCPNIQIDYVLVNRQNDTLLSVVLKTKSVCMQIALIDNTQITQKADSSVIGLILLKTVNRINTFKRQKICCASVSPYILHVPTVFRIGKNNLRLRNVHASEKKLVEKQVVVIAYVILLIGL